MPRLKPGTILPTPEEDAEIAAGIAADPDTYEPTDEEWAQMKPHVRIGRPPLPVTKERVTLRLDRDVLAAFRAGGPGWQSRINAKLREVVKE